MRAGVGIRLNREKQPTRNRWLAVAMSAAFLLLFVPWTPADLASADDATTGETATAAANPAELIEQARDMWSLQELVRPVVPQPDSAHPSFWKRHRTRIINPIDAFVLKQLAEKELTPAPQADKRTLVRRAYFDLIGLPPTPEQVARFLNDQSDDAWANLLDELLKSPRYGERWGRHWLDVARYADSGGYETDIYYSKAWRYRDYVVKSFNDDKPYDQFVCEQIAADELWPDNLDMQGSYELPKEKWEHLEAHVGTGLYAIGPQIHESNMDAGKRSYERLTDWVDTTASVFLGMTIGCARCHDHKFDPITQRDYFRMQAIFAPSIEVDRPLINPMAIASFWQHYPKLVAVDEARRAYRAFEKKVAGRALTADEEQKKQKLQNELAQSVLRLPEHSPEGEGGDRFDGLFEIPTARVFGHVRPALMQPVRLLDRGEVRRPKDEVSPGLPVALATITESERDFGDPLQRRKQLALWLTRPDHPLTARVMVNRVWLWHFGQGLVSTPNDFGMMGRFPTHPEMLDWLATEFVAQNWSLKTLHRLIMTSSTYRMASRFGNQHNQSVDPENHLLWRMNRRRLEAEALWDSMHAVAGTLNLKMGGRPVVPPLAEDEIAALRDRWQWTVSGNPADHTRRGLYILVRRNFRMPMFEAFDSPVNSVSCPCRDVTTVAPQALWFLNNKTSYRQAQHFAARLVSESGQEPGRWIERAWHIGLGRAPTENEKAEAVVLLDSLSTDDETAESTGANLPAPLDTLPASRAAALTKFCLTLFNLNEFAYID